MENLSENEGPPSEMEGNAVDQVQDEDDISNGGFVLFVRKNSSLKKARSFASKKTMKRFESMIDVNSKNIQN